MFNIGASSSPPPHKNSSSSRVALRFETSISTGDSFREVLERLVRVSGQRLKMRVRKEWEWNGGTGEGTGKGTGKGTVKGTGKGTEKGNEKGTEKGTVREETRVMKKK